MKIKQQQRRVKGKTGIIEYTLIRKKVKNLNMRVKSDGKILVSAPSLVGVNYIDKFVLDHENAISKVIQQNEQREVKSCRPKTYTSGEKITILGEDFHLLLELASVEGVDQMGQFLILRVKDTADLKRKEKVMKKWLEQKRLEIFLSICKEIYPLFVPYEVKYPLITIRWP